MGCSTERNEPRARGDRGAALVEFAFVMVLLFTLLFGIISFGLILSFKQDMTRAASEGARAGAVAFPATSARTNALASLDDSISNFGGSSWSGHGCQTNPRTGMACDAVVAPCINDPSVDCVTVTMVYDYDAHPLFGDIPLVSLFMPDQVKASAVARTNT